MVPRHCPHNPRPMPELPEVEFAAKRLREAAIGHTIARISALHPSQRRHLPPSAQRAAVGQIIDRVERRGKTQLIHLANGALIEVHFRMNGDWEFSRVDDDPPRHERVRMETTEGLRISLVDSRALSVVKLFAPGAYVQPKTGPEPLTDDFTVEGFREALARRSGPIKPVLLDQKIIAGIGNIYASEALWEARISPAAVASRLSLARVQRLRDALRHVLIESPPGRYYARDDVNERELWRVYGREGDPCRRCNTPIKRIVQAGRSTFYCTKCQR